MACAIACSGPSLRVLPPPPGLGQTEVLALGPELFALFAPDEGYGIALEAVPEKLEAGLFPDSMAELERGPGPVDLALAPDAYLPARTFAWTGTAWRPASSPELLADRGLGAVPAEPCVRGGGCWSRIPTRGLEWCRRTCEVEAPDPPAPVVEPTAFSAETLAAMASEEGMRVCREASGRWDPFAGCVPIGTACAPPGPAAGRVFVDPTGAIRGDGRTATAAIPLADALETSATELVLLEGDHRAARLVIAGRTLRGVCASRTTLATDLVLAAGTLRVENLRLLGSIGVADGATGPIELVEAIVEGPGPGHDEQPIVAAQGADLRVTRSYVGTVPRARLGADRSASFFLGFGPGVTTIEESEVWGRVGNQCAPGYPACTSDRLGLDLRQTVIVGGRWRGTVAVVDAPPTVLRRSLLLGGGSALEVGRSAITLEEVRMVGSEVGVEVEGGRVAGRGVELSSATTSIRATAKASVDLTGLRATLTREADLAIEIAEESRLSLRASSVRGAATRLVDLAGRASATLTDVRLEALDPRAPSRRTSALDVNEGSSLTLARVEAVFDSDFGLNVYGAEVEARDLTLRAHRQSKCAGMRERCETIGVWVGAQSQIALSRARLEGLGRGLELRSQHFSLGLEAVSVGGARCAVNGAVAEDWAPIATVDRGGAPVCSDLPAEE